MFRFFCVRCNRVKRVRNVPRAIQNVDSINPNERRGECDKHSKKLHTELKSIRRTA